MKLNYTPINTDTGKPLDDVALERMLMDWPGGCLLYGTQYVEAPNPKVNKRDMAVFLMRNHYTLSDELEAMIPKAEKIPDGAVA